MKTQKTHYWIGRGIAILIALVLVVSGTLKIIAFAPYKEMLTDLSPGYASNIYLLGAIALISGILFLIPRTFTVGFIAVLVFLGGTISAHMQHGDNFIPQLVFVLLTVFSAYLLKREWFSFRVKDIQND